MPAHKAIIDPRPEISLYRPRTVALLHRYFRLSMELGRLPQLVGREFFRSKVTSYRMTSFEDVVIFVHDVERCLARLDPFDQQVIARTVLQEYSHDEAADLLKCGRSTLTRRLCDGLNELSEILLSVGLLQPLPAPPKAEPNSEPKTCQDPPSGSFAASA